MKSEPSDPDAAGVRVAESGASAESPKSLWALMGKSAATSTPATKASEPTSRPVDAAMEFQAVEISQLQSPVDVERAADETDESDPDDELDLAPFESITEEDTETPTIAASPAEPQFTPQRSRGAVRSVILGGVAVLASALALLPELYAKIPGTLLGFLALMVGLLAMGEIRRSRGRQGGRNWAGTGIALGVLAMLLGPIAFSPLGSELRLRYGRRQTAKNLERVGTALNDYYHDHGHFPPGSIHEQKKGGEDVPLHNWTTMLLPYLGEDEAALHQKIDLKLPYNHETNRRAMERGIDAFYASGSSRQKTQAGFAVTHSVALGGTLDVENVGRVNVGVFSRNSRVKRSDVTDGLEHTLVAGEVAFDFPAWGEPGQYRSIGKGLNTTRDGFGNPDRTGAMFLRADGSVKFLSNKIDLDVLRNLSTRNGREKVERLSY
jgi:hypothetical protein